MALKLAEISESFRMLDDRRNVIRDCGLILGTWSALLLVLFLLQKLGLGVGFDVWPLGEDRVWIDILQRGQGGSAANIFWHINDRNPLSPWWYIALKNVILGVEPGLLIIRYVVGLGLALATYFLVVELAGQQARMFALGVALLVAAWMPNGYLDQIYWIFQAALIASMVSVLAYARFLNGGRGDHRWYALSLVCWFLAIASYSIQCGAVVAVSYLAFTRAEVMPKGGWRRFAAKLSVTITDTASYAVLLALFLLLWRTTVLNPSTYSLHPNVSNLVASLGQGIWHKDMLWWLDWAMQSPHRIAYAAAAIAAVPIMFLVLVRTWARSTGGDQPIGLRGLLDVFVVVACLAIPTVAVETAGSFWMPGWRWRMIYQLTTPILYLGLVAALICFIVRATSSRRLLWSAVVSISIGLALFMTLGHNRAQVDTTRNEKFVRDALTRAAAEDFGAGRRPPFQYLIKTDPAFWWYSSDLLSDVYAQGWFQRNDISFRIIPRTPGPAEHQALWSVKFLPDEAGVANARIPGILVKYGHISVLAIGNGRAERLSKISAADFAGLQVEWNRSGPVALPEAHTNGCSYSWPAEQDGLLSGWDVLERDEGGFARWTIRRRASVELSMNCSEKSVIRVVVVHAVSQRNFDLLRVEVNGADVPLQRSAASEGQIYEGAIPAGLMNAGRPAVVSLVVPGLDQIEGVPRRFGVLVRKIDIVPQAK
jgi:hypothetical protein